ncbi:MAG: A/G-specific adenine glycosylase [bacterium]
MDSRIQARVLRWYRANRRDLPWRRTGDPYAIWVSEVMLQQTRVDVVVPFYLAWMARFPTMAALAAASEEQVLEAWSGLGYYRRARNLHAAARLAASRLPQTAAGLRALPGIGAYTAAAVSSIAWGEPVACVDGNVERVIARVCGSGAAGPALRRQAWTVAQEWLKQSSPGDWNQAMMELGATRCTPRKPDCARCPLADLCNARRTGRQEELPAAKARRVPRRLTVRMAIVQRRGKVLLVRRSAGLLAGLWAPPADADRTGLARAVEQQTGVLVTAGPSIASVRHDFTHVRWDMRVHPAVVRAAPARLPRDARWVAFAKLPDAALSVAARKALRAARLKA